MNRITFAPALVMLLLPMVGHAQAYEDLMRRSQTSQARQAVVNGGMTNADIGSQADAAMRDRLQSLVSNGRCEDALRIAQSYKNETLIGNVRQACGS